MDQPPEIEERFVAFVRAVMVGRDGLHRTVLVDVFAAAGAIDAVSHITTGNVSFRLDPAGLLELIDDVESALEAVVGRRTEIFVRSVDELAALASSDPYGDQPLRVDHAREVTFFTDRVPAGLDLPLMAPAGDVVTFARSPSDRELLSVSIKESGVSRGAGGMIEAAAGERVTTRNWNTVERLLAKLA